MKAEMEEEVPPTKVYCEQDLEENELHAIGNGLALVYTGRSPGKESANEDAVAVLPFGRGSGVLVIADGAGGMPAGEKASAVAVRAIERSLRGAAGAGTDLRGAVISGIENANRELGERAAGAATTVAVVEIQDDSVRPYHVGDSQLLLMGGRGKLKFETVSHSPLGFGRESGALSKTELDERIDSSAVSSLLGFDPLKIEMNLQLELSSRDRIVLGSDGLFDVMSRDEILKLVSSQPLEKARDEMSKLVLSRMTSSSAATGYYPDDLTFVIFGPA